MTEKELKEIEDRAAMVAKGPWVIETAYADGGAYSAWIRALNGWVLFHNIDVSSPLEEITGAFIAACITDVPKMVAEIRRQQKEIERLQIGAQ